ncbi:MAG: GNAT family N-acetyltransferase [Clostridiales bacterium]|nr:GNAT family N-acetyltransferase [Clostridiales bacterium]
MQYIKVKEIDPQEQQLQIASLWHSAFGDSCEYVRSFIEKCRHKSVLAVFSENKIVSMLFLIDCEFKAQRGKYVYAVCTDEKYRRRGFAAALISEAKKCAGGFLCLIPADEQLKKYYAEMGFEEKLCGEEVKKNITFFENKEITQDLFEGSRLNVLTAMFYFR